MSNLDYESVHRATLALMAQRQSADLWKTLAEQAQTLAAASGSAVYLHDPARLDLSLAASAGLPAPPQVRVPVGRGLAGTVAQDGQPLRVDDYSAWAERSSLVDPAPLAAAAAVVLRSDSQLLGALVVYLAGPASHPLPEASLALLGLLAEAAVAAMLSLRQLDQARQRLSELEVVNQVAAALRLARTADDAFPLLLDETLAGLNAPAGSCWLYDPASDELVRAVARGAHLELPSRLKSSSGVAGRVLKTGQPYAAREYYSDPYAHESIRTQMPAGWGGAAVPLRVDQEVIGVLCVGVRLPRELALHEVNLLLTIADLAGAALERTRQMEEPHQRLQRLTAQRTIDTAIATSLDLNITLSIILDQVTARLSVNAACILLLNQGTQRFEYAAGRGFYTDAVTHSSLGLGEDYAGRAALGRRSYGLRDLSQGGDQLGRSNLLAGEGFVAHYGVPLIAKGRIKGLLEIFHRAPFDPNDEWFEFLEALAAQAAIAIDHALLFADLRRSNTELAQAYDTTLEGWSKALELRDQETQGHALRVTEMTLQLARAVGIDEVELVHIRRGALLHDMGKMGIPDSILLKPGPLTPGEREIMERHPEYAYQMLAPIAYLTPALDIPYCHHECWSGAGYPRGLKGDQIPLAARIFAVVDVWDALRSDRPYRLAWSEQKVQDYLRREAGAHFDAHIVEAFMTLIA